MWAATEAHCPPSPPRALLSPPAVVHLCITARGVSQFGCVRVEPTVGFTAHTHTQARVVFVGPDLSASRLLSPLSLARGETSRSDAVGLLSGNKSVQLFRSLSNVCVRLLTSEGHCRTGNILIPLTANVTKVLSETASGNVWVLWPRWGRGGGALYPCSAVSSLVKPTPLCTQCFAVEHENKNNLPQVY